MDTSIGKALIMIAGVLLAMLVIGFVTQTFNQTSQWASSEDQEEVIEQVQKFNKEWEVYDKDLMYGVDVISCLNKAKSNNDKIVADELDKNFAIEVSFEIKNDLKESITVYYIDEYSNEEEATTSWNSKVRLKNMNEKFKIAGTSVSSFDENQYLKSGTINSSKMRKGAYKLTYNNSGGDNERKLREQLEAISNTNDLQETVRNKDLSVKGDNNWIWSKAIYKSALHDLKLRKFKCDGITYKSDSGRVEKITFIEM